MGLYNFGIAPTSVKLRFKLFDSAGNGKTGIAYNTSGLSISTLQCGIGANDAGSTVNYFYSSTLESITTLGTYETPTGAKARFKEVDATYHPGVYELQLPDSRFSLVGDATKPMTLLVSISGVTGMVQQDFIVECKKQEVDKTGYALTSDYDAAKTAAQVGSAMTLTSDYNAAKTAASQSSVDSVKASVDGISNVTRLSVALFAYMQRPASGNKYVKVEVALKDESGSMEDPDGNQLALTVYNPAGTSLDGNLFKGAPGAGALDSGTGTFATYKKLVKDGTGLYSFYYKVAYNADEEELTFKFGWEEGGSALYEYRASQVCDAANDLSAIRLKTDNLPASPAAVGDAMTLTSGAREAIVDDVWDEFLGVHIVPGSAAVALSDAGAAQDPSAVAAAVWNSLRASYTGTGTFGEYLTANVTRINGATTIDGLALTTWFENLLAHAQGDIVRTGNLYEYKKQDGTTNAFDFTSSSAGRS